jgi:hypothetical protein
MAKIKQKKLVVDLAPGVDFWDWYQRDAAADVDAWLAAMDAGDVSDRFATTEEPEVNIPSIEGTFDFAVIQKDAAGNESDPVSFAGWRAVPLDLSPPPQATGGDIIDA